jgi:hypothetical protein
MKIHKLAVDKKSGAVVSIQEVPNGLSCHCICPDCKKTFVAVQGQKNDWHFRHYEETNCKGGQETALHQLAKEIILTNSRLDIPTYGTIIYESPHAEMPFQKIIPDVTAKIIDENLFFEIHVTHAVDERKKKFYTDGEHKSIEIDLRNYTFTTRENLAFHVLSNIGNKHIIFWKKKVVATAGPDYSWILWIAIVIFTYFGMKGLFKRTSAFSYQRT